MPDLIVERDGGIVRATLNRPERKNALTYALFDELRALFDEVEASPTDRALVLRGLMRMDRLLPLPFGTSLLMKGVKK